MQKIYKESEIEQIFSEFASAPENSGLSVPPPSFREMEGRFIEYEYRKALVCSFPVKEKYLNPMGVMQGGFIAAAIDNTMGPLSYLTAKKGAVTLNLSLNYIRGIREGDVLKVKAWVKSRGLSSMYIQAEATGSNGKLIADAYCQVLILGKPG